MVEASVSPDHQLMHFKPASVPFLWIEKVLKDIFASNQDLCSDSIRLVAHLPILSDLTL